MHSMAVFQLGVDFVAPKVDFHWISVSTFKTIPAPQHASGIYTLTTLFNARFVWQHTFLPHASKTLILLQEIHFCTVITLFSYCCYCVCLDFLCLKTPLCWILQCMSCLNQYTVISLPRLQHHGSCTMCSLLSHHLNLFHRHFSNFVLHTVVVMYGPLYGSKPICCACLGCPTALPSVHGNCTTVCWILYVLYTLLQWFCLINSFAPKPSLCLEKNCKWHISFSTSLSNSPFLIPLLFFVSCVASLLDNRIEPFILLRQHAMWLSGDKKWQQNFWSCLMNVASIVLTEPSVLICYIYMHLLDIMYSTPESFSKNKVWDSEALGLYWKKNDQAILYMCSIPYLPYICRFLPLILLVLLWETYPGTICRLLINCCWFSVPSPQKLEPPSSTARGECSELAWINKTWACCIMLDIFVL